MIAVTPRINTPHKHQAPVKQPAASPRGGRPSTSLLFCATIIRRGRLGTGYGHAESSTQAVFELVQGRDELRRVRAALFRAPQAAAAHHRNLSRRSSGAEGEEREEGGVPTCFVTCFIVVIIGITGLFLQGQEAIDDCLTTRAVKN